MADSPIILCTEQQLAYRHCSCHLRLAAGHTWVAAGNADPHPCKFNLILEDGASISSIGS